MLCLTLRFVFCRDSNSVRISLGVLFLNYGDMCTVYQTNEYFIIIGSCFISHTLYTHNELNSMLVIDERVKEYNQLLRIAGAMVMNINKVIYI